MPDAHAETPAIEVRHLTRRFGSLTAVDDVSFTVMRGQVVGFLGPNGAGKSTTLRILAGLLSATSGQAWVTGLPVTTHMQTIKSRIGYMPEMNPLPEDVRVEEYLRFRARIKGLPRHVQRERVAYALEICDLQHKARRKIIGTLSKGYRQRVGIADVILGQPDVVIMDEPTIGLDPHQVLGIRRLIDSMRGQMTVILSSHILSEIERSCDSVIIINHGKLVAQGSPEALRREFVPGQRYRLIVRADESRLKPLLENVLERLSFVRSEPAENDYHAHLIELPMQADAGARIVQTLVREHGLELRELTPLQPHLEDVFLAATRQSWRETAPLLGEQAKEAQSV